MLNLYDYILEKREITFKDTNPRFGQCIILAGGAASGKGFVQNRIDADFKVFDVDELKKLYMKLAAKGVIDDDREYSLNNYADTATLHQKVKNMGSRHQGWKQMVRDEFKNQRMADNAKELTRLPNVLFDMVSEDPKDIQEVLDMVEPLGYNVTLVWVACNMNTSRVSNIIRGIGEKDEARSVPEDVLVKGHAGAYKTVTDILMNKYKDISERIDHAWVAFGTGWGRKLDDKYAKNSVIEVPKSNGKFHYNKAEVDAFLKEEQPINYGFLKSKMKSSNHYDQEKCERFMELVPVDKSLLESAEECDRDMLMENELVHKLMDYNML